MKIADLRQQKVNNKKRKDPVVKILYEEKQIKSSTENIFLPKVAPSQATNRRNFNDIYSMIKEMRKERNAPVDTMGSYQNPDLSAPKEVQDYQLLISLLLSVQTKDEPTTKAMNRLIKHGLTIEEIYNLDEEELKKMISCVNFKNNKAKYIKKVTDLLMNKYKRKIPDSLEELLKLPGVGKETAICYLNHAHDQKRGIGVDTHIHRICNRLGWVDTKTPEQTRIEMESFVPKDLWYEINETMVGFGQQICTPLNPKCEGCLLKDICPTGINNLGSRHGQVGKKIKKGNNIEIKVIEEKVENNEKNSDIAETEKS